MTGVSFPVQVVVLLRRLVNVISTLSVSNQYLLRNEQNGAPGESADEKYRKRGVLSALKLWEKPLLQSSNIHASTSSFPWWSPSMFSMATETHIDSPPDAGLPPNHYKPPRKAPSPSTPSPEDSKPEAEQDPPKLDAIHQLLAHPALFDPLRTPRYPIVLSHGLYGFDTRGPSTFPSMRMHYWANVLNILRSKVGAEVIVTSVPGTGSISSRAEALNEQLQTKARGRGVNFMAHSMGGLDCRHLISHIKPTEYVPLSLTSIGTPHRGSPFMDWCTDNIGIGKLKREELLSRSAAVEDDSKSEPSASKLKDGSFSFTQLPSSFVTLLLGLVDSPAYANLTTTYLNTVFNPQTPDDPRVKYFSVAGRMPGVNIWHPFWLPKMVLDGAEAKERQRLRETWEMAGGTEADPIWRREREWGNDGLVTVQSAKWGEFLGIMEGCDHWEMRGARGIEFGVDLPALPSIGLGSSTTDPKTSPAQGQGEGWGLMDWGRFVRAWKKEEKTQREASASAAAPGHPQQQEEQIKQKTADAIVKNSTEKVSSAFDWLMEQVPVPPLPLLSKDSSASAKGKAVEDAKNLTEAEVKRMDADAKEKPGQGKTSSKKAPAELASKADLERFYVALSRKMYDEGL